MTSGSLMETTLPTRTPAGRGRLASYTTDTASTLPLSAVYVPCTLLTGLIALPAKVRLSKVPHHSVNFVQSILTFRYLNQSFLMRDAERLMNFLHCYKYINTSMYWIVVS